MTDKMESLGSPISENTNISSISALTNRHALHPFYLPPSIVKERHAPTMTGKDEGAQPSPGTSEAPNLVSADKPPMAATKAQSGPPPEKPETVRIKFLAMISFWVVIVFFGLPMWWKTTSIYRARLPLQEMIDWADGKVSRQHTFQQYNGWVLMSWWLILFLFILS